MVGALVGGGAANAGDLVSATCSTLVSPPWLDPASHIALLNLGFPGQWDRRTYDWYLRRGFRGICGDILVRAEGTRVVAGMAMGHRQIRIGGGKIVDVHVISAGVTLRAEQGRGHYAALLQMAVERAREQRSAALVGFVTSDNGSGRGLQRLGARAIPSFYVFSGDPPRLRSAVRTLHTRRIGPDEERVAREQAPASHSCAAHFHYAREQDWRDQFVRRPNAVSAVRTGHDSLALVESVGSTDRLQWLACPDGKSARAIAALAAHSAALQRRFFFYTLDPLQAAAAQRAGLRVRKGYLMVQPTGGSPEGWEALAHARWSVQSGDRL